VNLALAVVHVTGRANRASAMLGVPVSPVIAAVSVLCFIAAIYFASHPRAVVPQPKLAAAIAQAAALTYGLFLVHSQFGFAVIDLVAGILPTAVVVAAAFAVSLALAWLIHRFVERPLNRPIRQITERMLMKGDAAAT
jgi:peptidoglycan/LPS O-acetylase OafA/YrhL